MASFGVLVSAMPRPTFPGLVPFSRGLHRPIFHSPIQEKLIMKRTHPLQRIAFTAMAAAAMMATTHGAFAAGAVGFSDWNGAGNAPTLALGDSLSATSSLLKSGYSDNPQLMYSAWAHTGVWYQFQLTTAGNVSIDLTPVSSNASFAPGITVYSSGANPFDGGTEGTESGNNGWDSPHSFNAVGQIGDFGTDWASGANGNLQRTLAYAVTGPSHTDTSTTGWGESIQSGFNSFESGITGTASGNTIGMQFSGLAAGWYTMFVGGTNHRLSSADYTLSISAVPVPEPQTWGLMLAGMAALALRARRRKA